MRVFLIFLALSAIAGAVWSAEGQTVSTTPVPDTKAPGITDWLRDARYGLFTHFLPGPDPVVSGKLMEDFDVEALADQVKESGASYLVFTLHQNSGWINSPNATYDRITGYAPGERTSKRDLPADLAKALAKRGLRLLLYVPCQVPNEDRKAQQAFGLEAKRGDRRIDPVFAVKWAQVIEEWSKRYGTSVSGWWFDGGYSNIGFTPEIGAILAKGAKAGNPASIVAFNPGIMVKRHCAADDYTAGELNEPFTYLPTERFLDGAQWHALTYLGSNWGHRDVRYTPEKWITWMKQVIANGGAVTLDVGPTYDAKDSPIGTLSETQMKQLKAIRAAIAPVAPTVPASKQ
ncbi:MAG: alpha-L-fucosidase [bacterium]